MRSFQLVGVINVLTNRQKLNLDDDENEEADLSNQ
jgi:hypothetical protein